MNLYVSETMAAERRRDLIAEAARARLVAVATCCRAGALARTASRLRGAWAALSARRATACCAA